MTRSRPHHGSSRIWRWPLVLAGLTTFGLVSALLGQSGIWWGLSWIALSIPLVVIVACLHRRDRAARPS
jgi:dolichyl-phosphate-mannose--protein O-mannosyl transferase